ncbi:hypothetical protein EDD17DRAFT_1507755 [Pisolithus thermaeus]|nr:hypothetical protein EDD17DRAFT_1507755 [Pisolithus thermaeus]
MSELPLKVQGQAPWQPASICGWGHGGTDNPETPPEWIPTIQWDDKDLNRNAFLPTLPHIVIVIAGYNSTPQIQVLASQQVGLSRVSLSSTPSYHYLIYCTWKRLCKKYHNEVNKSLGSTGGSLMAEEIQDNPELKKLLGT